MANPMPDIFSGFTGGLQQGLQMGLLLRQQREQKDQQDITNALNMVKINTDLLGVKGLPAENKQKLFGNVLSVFKKYGDKIGLDKDSIPDNITWTDDNAQYAKEMSTIIDTWKSGGFGKNIYDAEPITQLKTGLLGIANRFGESLKVSEAVSIGESLSKQKPDIKEINLPPIIDLFLTQKYGSAYTSATPEDRKKYLDYMSTDAGKKDFEVAAPKLAQMMATPFYQVVPTSEGLIQFNTRQPGVSVATGKDKPLTGEMVTTEQQFGTLQDGFNQVKSTYKKGYVGPVSGRVGSAKEKTVGIPDEQAAFYSALEGMKNQLIYALSGKQINESEYNRLLKQLPDRNLPDKVFESRMKEFERTLNSIISGRHKAMGGYGIPPEQPKGGSKFEIIGVE